MIAFPATMKCSRVERVGAPSKNEEIADRTAGVAKIHQQPADPNESKQDIALKRGTSGGLSEIYLSVSVSVANPGI